MSEPRKRSWLRRYRWLVLSVAMVACYLLGGFVGVPLMARHLVLPRINDRLNGQIVVERFACNPIRLNLRLFGVDVRNAAGESVAGFGSFVGDLKLWATISRAGIHFEQVEVFDYHGRAVVDEQGRLDLATLLKPVSASTQARKPIRALPRLVIEKLGAERGRLVLTDRARSEPFELDLHDINVRADNFDSVSTHLNQLTLSAHTPSEDRFSGTGSIRFDPLSIAISIDASGVDLTRFQPYLGLALSSRLTSGVSAAKLTLDIAPLAEPYRATIGLDDVRVDNIDLTLEGQPLVRVAETRITSVRADLLQRRLTVGPVELRGVGVRVERRADGTLTVQDVLKPITLPSAVARDDSIEDFIERIINALEAVVTSALGPWELTAEQVGLADATITLVDRTPATPVTIELTDLSLGAGPASSETGFDAPIELAASWGDGRVNVAGRVRAEPVLAELDIDLSSIDLASLSAYVPLSFDAPMPPTAAVTSGLADVKGRLAARIDGQTIEASWDGQAALRKLVVEPLAGAESISATGKADVTLASDQPLRASFVGDIAGTSLRAAVPDLYAIDATLGGVAITGLRVALPVEAIDAGSVVLKAPNLSLEYPAVSAPIDESPDLAGTFTIELPLALRLGEVQITDGRVVLVDPGASPRVEANVDQLAMKVAPIDTSSPATSSLDLSGRVQSTGRFEITGTLDPLKLLRQTDVRLVLQSVPMKPFEAASGRYLGYLVESGRLGLTFPIRIDSGSLDGQLQLNLDRFYLGSRVESPDALKLPVRLGLDLLRDPREQIDLNLQITGDLNDPRFSILRLAWQALGGVMNKAVTAPFQLLASAFGAGDRDISQVTFNPGAHELTPDAIATLDVVARALTQRPRLTLVLKPGVVDADIRALRLAALRSELFEEARQIDPNLQQLDDVTLAAMVQARYQAIIPPTPDTPAASDDEMLDAMLASIEIRPEWVDALRQSRVQAVIDLIVTDGGIDAARIAVEPVESAEGPRVVFDLR